MLVITKLTFFYRHILTQIKNWNTWKCNCVFIFMGMKLLYYNMGWRQQMGVSDSGCRGQQAVSICTCHYMLFPFPLLHADCFWFSQYCDTQNGYFYCWCKSHCSNISLVLLTKRKYQIPARIPTNISDRFRAFRDHPNNCWDRTLNHISTTTVSTTTASTTTVNVLPCHHSLSSR
jgi:hypothetical protein